MTPPSVVDLPDEGYLPSLSGATGWLNSPPLTAAHLQGKVVLINFCTYTCVNWLRALPYLRAWYEAYHGPGFVIIGVHTPEFDIEHDLDNVGLAIENLRVDYPIAIDNDYAIWDAFGNRCWPAFYFADRHGQIRHHHFGEGKYEQSEGVLRRLLTEVGSGGIGDDLVSAQACGVEAPADWDSLRSPENYLGYGRSENFASPDGAVLETPHVYVVPARLALNHWALVGEWTVRVQSAVLHQAEGRIAYRFHARDLHLVMGAATPGASARFRVHLDGRPPGAAHGTHVDGLGNGRAKQPRLYHLVRQCGPVTERTFEIVFFDPGVQVYAFSFG